MDMDSCPLPTTFGGICGGSLKESGPAQHLKTYHVGKRSLLYECVDCDFVTMKVEDLIDHVVDKQHKAAPDPTLNAIKIYFDLAARLQNLLCTRRVVKRESKKEAAEEDIIILEVNPGSTRPSKYDIKQPIPAQSRQRRRAPLPTQSRPPLPPPTSNLKQKNPVLHPTPPTPTLPKTPSQQPSPPDSMDLHDTPTNYAESRGDEETEQESFFTTAPQMNSTTIEDVENNIQHLMTTPKPVSSSASRKALPRLPSQAKKEPRTPSARSKYSEHKSGNKRPNLLLSIRKEQESIWDPKRSARLGSGNTSAAVSVTVSQSMAIKRSPALALGEATPGPKSAKKRAVKPPKRKTAFELWFEQERTSIQMANPQLRNNGLLSRGREKWRILPASVKQDWEIAADSI